MIKQKLKYNRETRIKSSIIITSLLGLVVSSQASALSTDYYIDYSIASGIGGYATTTVHQHDPGPGGNVLQRPDDACGMRFEFPDDADWIVPVYPNVDTGTNGAINVWLPSNDCGAWNNIVVEPDIGSEQIGPPYSVPGTLRIEDAKAYWIDGTGNKLIYYYCCGIDHVYNNDLQVSRQGGQKLLQLKKLLWQSTDSKQVSKPLIDTRRFLMNLERQLNSSVSERRRQDSDKLELSIRSLESQALNKTRQAIQALSTGLSHLRDGNFGGTRKSCDKALASLEAARSALATTANWLQYD